MARDDNEGGPCSDEALVEAWQRGDQRAGKQLFERYHAPIARFFMNKLGSHDSDDLVQRTFLGLVEGRDRFRGDAKVRHWIYAIARKQLLNYFRDIMRDRARFDPSHTSLAALDPTPTQKLAASDEDRLLVHALRQLPLDVQLMFELHYWEKMQLKDIAVIFEMTPGGVRAALFRSRKRLKEHMIRLANSPAELERSLGGLSTWAAELNARPR